MACKKSELVQAINSYAAARSSGDNPLVVMAADRLNGFIESLAFEVEEETNVDPAN
jgi:hypothetical protein